MFWTWMLLCFGFGLGLCLIVSGQEWWQRPKPDLRGQLRRLSVEGSYALERQGAGTARPLYRSSVLERLVRPLAEDAGRLVAGIAGHLGLGGEEWERKLALAGQPMTLSQFFGQKVLAGLAGLAFFPLATLLDVTFVGPWPLEFWLGGFAVGFLLPDWLVAGRLRARRERILRELPVVLDLLAIAISAGMGLEQALQTVANQGTGLLMDELKALVRELSLGEKGMVELLGELERWEGSAELAAFVGALRGALLQGTALGETLGAQAVVVRERARLRLVEAGGRASVKMLLPIGFLVLPAYILVILFPAAIQLLGLAS
jgi:tight adherence protein C